MLSIIWTYWIKIYTQYLIIKYKKKIDNHRFNISNVIEYLYKKDDKLPPPGLWRDLYNIPNINEIIKF